MIGLFSPARFLTALLYDLWAHLGVLMKCRLVGHDDKWVKRSMGDRCECCRCGRSV